MNEPNELQKAFEMIELMTKSVGDVAKGLALIAESIRELASTHSDLNYDDQTVAEAIDAVKMNDDNTMVFADLTVLGRTVGETLNGRVHRQAPCGAGDAE